MPMGVQEKTGPVLGIIAGHLSSAIRKRAMPDYDGYLQLSVLGLIKIVDTHHESR